jgi:hypothetical protein
MRRVKRTSIEVVERGHQRAVVSTYSDGGVVEIPVDADVLPKRKPGKSYARAWSGNKDKTRKKHI